MAAAQARLSVLESMRPIRRKRPRETRIEEAANETVERDDSGKVVKLSDFDALVICPVCQCKFNQTNRLPKCLPCLHNVCLVCVPQMPKPLCCPVCRSRAPRGAVAKLPNNFLILSMLDVLDKSTSVSTSSSSVSSSQGSQATSAPAVMCSLPGHGDCELRYFCTACKEAVCSDCLVLSRSEHLNHPRIPIIEATQALRSALSQSVEQVRARISQLQDITRRVEMEQASFTERSTAIDMQISSMFDRYRHELHGRELELKKLNMDLHKANNTKLQQQKDDLEFNITQMQSSCEAVDSALGNPAAALRLLHDSKATLSDMLDRKFESDPIVFQGLRCSLPEHLLSGNPLGEVIDGNRELTPISLEELQETMSNTATKVFKADLRSLRYSLSDQLLSDFSKKSPQLQELDVSWCQSLTDSSFIALSKGCPQLQQLSAKYCKSITDTSIVALSKCCSQLQQLNVAGCNKLTDLSIKAIGIGCPNLKYLNVVGCNNVTHASILAISAARPLLTAVSDG